MSPRTLRSNRRRGDYVVATIAPANRLAEPRFGVVDTAIVGLFLVIAGSLIYLILG